MKKMIPVIIAIALICIVISMNFGKQIYDKYSYGQDYADLNEFFKIYEASEVPIILQDARIEEKAKVIDGNIYFDQDTVEEYFATRFYRDKKENLLLYTLATGTVSSEIGSSSYTKGDETVALAAPSSLVRGDVLYISIDYLKLFVNFSYDVFDNPKRMQIYTEWDLKTVATITADTHVRWRGGVKSEILRAVSEGEKVEILEEMDDWTKVKTDDAFIGYVENSKLSSKSTEVETPVLSVPKEEFPSLTRDFKINLTWDYMEAPQGGTELTATLSNTKALNVVSPTWFWLTDNDGNIKSIGNESYVKTAHKKGVEVWALVSNFHAGTDVAIEEVLSYTSKRAVLINNLVNETLKYGADGINIDFESVPASCGPDYVQFIRELSLVCHANNLLLSVDNYVPTEYTAHYNRTEQGPFVDYIIIMGYDEHYAGSAVGSVASVNWMKTGIEKTVNLVGANKVINAIPFYTRVWKTKKDSVSSEAVTMQVAKDFISRNKIKTKWDEETMQNYGEATLGGVLYQVWLEDADSVKTRLNVMQSYNIAGVASWRVGQETSDVWDVIAAYMQQ